MEEYSYHVQDGLADADAADAPKALSVSAANRLAKRALEQITVRILGEVSEVSRGGYKAMYFTLKDESASLPCMMWTNRYKAAGLTLAVGMMVEVTGRFTLYDVKGRMNFDVFSITLAGEGKLRLQVAELARKLDAEGLCDPAVKRPLPTYPQRIGLVTSPRGAAVHDVLRTLRRLWPAAEVLLAGVPVEGATAAAGIVEGMRSVADAGAEVVLVVRGGGSFEDLMPFNDEALARAIRACPVPVVTGIGHEPDTTIADMVADRRASTPTAAAEAAVPDAGQLTDHLDARGSAMASRMRSRLERSALVLQRYAMLPFFREPQRLFDTDLLAMDDLSMRLHRVLPDAIAADRRNLDEAALRLSHAAGTLLTRPRATLEAASDRMALVGRGLPRRFENALAVAASRLHDLSPLQVLARGYAIARTDGGVVKSVVDVREGERVALTVSDGVIDCDVVATHAETRDV